ncbi:MAG: AAA family ATPase, partial [Lentisphaerae bacterium]|nr:AAA family ATPase [Lentisphaerota bacterium]
MNYIPRHYEQLVLDASAEYGAVMVAGPRQVGKTTMLLQLCRTSERRYVTLDDLNARELAKNDPVMFFQIYPPPVLVDEVQYAPELFSTIKLMVDRAKAPGSFWLTGSQPFLLMDLAQESLAGRAAVLHLAPLSSREIQKAPLTDPFVPDVLQL